VTTLARRATNAHNPAVSALLTRASLIQVPNLNSTIYKAHSFGLQDFNIHNFEVVPENC
jgi:hypothetical protein